MASLAEGHTGAPWLIGAPVSEYLPAEAERHIGNAYKEANARLIAAAPELLDACKDALAFLRCDLGIPEREMILRLELAIAKAKGE